ncbi:type II toxin-antitoxin system RelE family toxin [Frankia sp. Cr2]|uniref:type II toxin-antitoxin system RelE family toxin n=1 Tax=Frankia sp. Cr2 TaxID=3073932 RepID=UPI002AD337A6|nr:type II toxin-antitoxin system RelE/ParE family toxin [Frankia sp. Cr2]
MTSDDDNPPRYELRFQPAARRGTYRIVYRIDEDARTVHILDVDHRADIYRTR